MIIVIIHFGSGTKQPELFETVEDLMKFRRTTLHYNLDKDKDNKVVKIEASKDMLIQYHNTVYNRFGEKYKIGRQ